MLVRLLAESMTEKANNNATMLNRNCHVRRTVSGHGARARERENEKKTKSIKLTLLTI